MDNKKLKVLSYLSVALTLTMLSTSGCEDRTRVVIEGGSVPRFKLSGVGKIQVITISGPDLERQSQRGDGTQLAKPYWQIVPKGEYDVRTLEVLGPLVYGEVPDGFAQIYPKPGTAPPPLFDGGWFTFELAISDANGLGGVRFTIRNGKAFQEGS